MTYINERAMKLAAEIRSAEIWDMDALAELCKLAGMEAAWAAADDSSFEQVAFAAAERLGADLL